MHRSSRKAQHNSFAHHRAALLFSNLPAEGDISANRPATADAPGESTPELRERVGAGILGFVRAAARPACAA